MHIYKPQLAYYLQTPMAAADPDYSEDEVGTPRDSPSQREIRSGYTGPKTRGEGKRDTTGTHEIGVMIYPPDDMLFKSYSGQWKDGKFDGQGTIVYETDDRYNGGFKNGRRQGQGVYIYSNGDVRDGEFMKDKQVTGKLIRHDFIYDGTFNNNEQLQMGKVISKNDGTIFEGRIYSDEKRVGTFKYPTGDVFSGTWIYYEDEWVLDGANAKMVVIMPDKTYIYKGSMRHGQRHGIGTMRILSGPTVVKYYSARFNGDVEVIDTIKNLKEEEEEEDEEDEENTSKRRGGKHFKRRSGKHSKRRGGKHSKGRGGKHYSRRSSRI